MNGIMSNHQYCPAGSTAPLQCAAGNVCLTAASQIPCNISYYCPANTSVLNLCAAGSYCPNTSSQILCTTGNYCPTGSTSQNPCPAGFMCPNTTQKVACTLGNYCGNGTTNQSICPLGFVCTNPASKIACTTSNFCPAGSSAQLPCAAGFYCPNASVQLMCPPGSFCMSGVTSPSTCSACNNGQYIASACVATANVTCLLCNDLVSNSTYVGIGSAAGNCPWACNPSYYLNSSRCNACPANSWCNANIQNVCPNNAVSSALSSAQNECLCAPGYAGNGTVSGTSPCSLCKAGFYCPGGNGNLSIACGQNFSSPVGSYSFSSCQCIPGYQRTSPYTCQLCAPGDVCESGTLSTCPSNSLSPAGSNNLDACVCNPGFYGPAGGPCVPCPANAFCPGGNSITACTANAISPAESTNSSACYCDRGYQGINNAPCVACPPNTWCWTGILNMCPTNTFSAALSSWPTNCTCIPGFTGPSGSACVPCTAGSYKPTNGSAACTVCPANNYCPQASSSPTACPISNSSSPSGSISASQCLCNPGYYGVQCLTCPIAHYCPGATAGNPSYPCPNRGYTLAQGSSAPSQCICPTNSALNSSGICECFAGYTHIIDSSSPSGWRCGVCPVGAYCIGDGNAYACPANSTSPAQSVNYLACVCASPQFMLVSPPVNTHPSMRCEKCAANQYYISNTKCGTCPTNSTSPAGTPSVSGCSCDQGTFQVSNQQSPSGIQCSACPLGMFCQGGATPPTQCPSIPKQASYLNSSTCEWVCNNGYVGPNCDLCAAGSWCASGVSKQCPENSTSPTGAYSLYQCICKPGFIGQDIYIFPCIPCGSSAVCSSGAPIPGPLSPRPINATLQLVKIVQPLPLVNGLAPLVQSIPSQIAAIQANLPNPNLTLYTYQTCRPSYCIACDGSETCVPYMWVSITEKAGRYSFNVSSVPANTLITFVVNSPAMCQPTLNLQSEYIEGLNLIVASESGISTLPFVCSSNASLDANLTVTGTTSKPTQQSRRLMESRRLMQLISYSNNLTVYLTIPDSLIQATQTALNNTNTIIQGYSTIEEQIIIPSATNASCPTNAVLPPGATSISQCVCSPGYYGTAIIGTGRGTGCTLCPKNSYCKVCLPSKRYILLLCRMLTNDASRFSQFALVLISLLYASICASHPCC